MTSLHSIRRGPAFGIRPAEPADRDTLIDIWWRSAQATHTFLTQRELQALLPDVQALQLETLDTWVLCDLQSRAIGFLVMTDSEVDALFIAPEWLRRGGGSLLLDRARSLANAPLTVQVNEENIQALAFYLARGFSIVSRSPVDREGRPYPLLHLAEVGDSGAP